MTTPGNGSPAQSPSAQQQGQAAARACSANTSRISRSRTRTRRARWRRRQTQPAINIQINVGIQQLAETDYEVSLKLEGKAESADTILFAFDLTFAGVFRVQNVPAETLQPLVMIECPRLLFPFAREIIATAVRNGGFPPLLLDPVDFVALYQQRAAQTQPPQAAATSS